MEQRSNDVALKDAIVLLKREEYASSMEQRLNTNDAALKDAKVLLRREECALSTGQSSRDAAAKDAQIKPRREECASGMEQSSNNDLRHVAKIKLCSSQGCTNQSRRCENSTQTMQQRWMHKSCHQRSSMHLAWGSIDKETSISEGCRNLVNEEDYSGDTANTASITKNLQLSHCVLDLNLIRLRR
jgi:hypothetical protein